MFGYSRIYGYVSLVIASIITIILLGYFIHIGIILDFSTSAPLGALLFLVVVYFFVYFIAYMQSFSILSKKYEYTFENYKYSIKKEVLESGEERYYPLVSVAKYSVEQYIEHTYSNGKNYYKLTSFETDKNQKEYRPPEDVYIYYPTEDEAKKTIENYKNYWIEVLKNREKYEKENSEKRRLNVVKSSEIIKV